MRPGQQAHQDRDRNKASQSVKVDTAGVVLRVALNILVNTKAWVCTDQQCRNFIWGIKPLRHNIDMLSLIFAFRAVAVGQQMPCIKLKRRDLFKGSHTPTADFTSLPACHESLKRTDPWM